MAKIDKSMLSAVEMYFKYGIHPGSCTSYIINDDYNGAYIRAHPHLKRTDELFKEIYDTVLMLVPPNIRDMDEWNGYKNASEAEKFELLLLDNKMHRIWISELEQKGA